MKRYWLDLHRSEDKHSRVTHSKSISVEAFGALPDGRTVERYVLKNSKGESVSVINYGAIITSIMVPDREGQLGEVTLGYEELESYFTDRFFLGAVVGRFANRIANGRFELDGKSYALVQNQGTNHLHGGPDGYYRALWQAQVLHRAVPTVELWHESPDGDAGFPGELHARVRYAFDDECRLTVTYEATTSKPTVVNLTQHSYFNLAGSGTIVDHELQLAASQFTPTDKLAIPTGELRNVAGTALDFRALRRIGDAIDAPEEQLQFGEGYDHNFVVEGDPGTRRFAAQLQCSRSGRNLRVDTTEPGIQFYSGNFLTNDGTVGRGSTKYGRRGGLCLETQHYPDSPNKPHFPSTRLDPGQTFSSQTVFQFGIY